MFVRIVGCERGVEKENGSGHTPELFLGCAFGFMCRSREGMHVLTF